MIDLKRAALKYRWQTVLLEHKHTIGAAYRAAPIVWMWVPAHGAASCEPSEDLLSGVS